MHTILFPRARLFFRALISHLEQIDGSHHVVAVVQKRLLHALTHCLDGSKMNYTVYLVLKNNLRANLVKCKQRVFIKKLFVSTHFFSNFLRY